MPPKRKTSAADLPSAKRARTEETFHIASHSDVLSHILSFLTVGETLMYAMTGKTVYDAIEGIVYSQAPFVLRGTWSITKALRGRKCLTLRTQSDVEKVKPSLSKNEFSKLSSIMCLSRAYPYGPNASKDPADFEDYIDILSEKMEGTITTKAVIIQKGVHDEEDVTKYEKEERELPIRAGFQIENLRIQELNVESPDSLLDLLRHTINIRSLEVTNVEVDYFAKRAKKAPKKADFWHQKCYPGVIALPVTEPKNLKQVVEDKGLTYQSGKGFYQVSKKEAITAAKKIIVINESSHEMYRDDDALAQLGLQSRPKFDLSPVDDFVIFVQSTSHNRKLPEDSYVLYEPEEGEEVESDEREEGDDDDEEEEDNIVLPILSQLQRLSLHAFDYDSGDSYLTQILQAAPNLEELSYIYHVSPQDNLLDFIAEHNPKLKSVFFLGDDGATPCETGFSDEAILRFFSKVKLEHANFYHSCGISGELFKNLGEYAPELRSLKVQRVAFNGDLVDEADDVVFGGKKMEKVMEFRFGDVWENLGVEFFDSIIEFMPNIKVLYLDEIFQEESKANPAMITRLVDAFDLEVLSIGAFVNHDLLRAIAKKTNLRKLHVGSHYRPTENPWTVEILQEAHWPNLRSLTIPFSCEDLAWLEAIEKACPNVRTISIMTSQDKTEYSTLLTFLKDENHWPHLRRCLCDCQVELNKVRPTVSCKERFEMSERRDQDLNSFYRLWLYSDNASAFSSPFKK